MDSKMSQKCNFIDKKRKNDEIAGRNHAISSLVVLDRLNLGTTSNSTAKTTFKTTKSIYSI
jgi:hypothetical protein